MAKCSRIFAFLIAWFLSMGNSALVSIGSGTDGDTVMRSSATAAGEGSSVLSVWPSESAACSGESGTSSDTDDVPYV